ncbi:hypothetical protein PCE1_002100 [Barthelona sp. PCE]
MISSLDEVLKGSTVSELDAFDEEISLYEDIRKELEEVTVQQIVYEFSNAMFPGTFLMSEFDMAVSTWRELKKYNVRSVCGHVLSKGEFIYECEECCADKTAIFCEKCFEKTHNLTTTTHNYTRRRIRSDFSAICDCGTNGVRNTDNCHKSHTRTEIFMSLWSKDISEQSIGEFSDVLFKFNDLWIRCLSVICNVFEKAIKQRLEIAEIIKKVKDLITVSLDYADLINDLINCHEGIKIIFTDYLNEDHMNILFRSLCFFIISGCNQFSTLVTSLLSVEGFKERVLNPFLHWYNYSVILLMHNPIEFRELGSFLSNLTVQFVHDDCFVRLLLADDDEVNVAHHPLKVFCDALLISIGCYRNIIDHRQLTEHWDFDSFIDISLFPQIANFGSEKLYENDNIKMTRSIIANKAQQDLQCLSHQFSCLMVCFENICVIGRFWFVDNVISDQLLLFFENAFSLCSFWMDTIVSLDKYPDRDFGVNFHKVFSRAVDMWDRFRRVGVFLVYGLNEVPDHLVNYLKTGELPDFFVCFRDTESPLIYNRRLYDDDMQPYLGVVKKRLRFFISMINRHCIAKEGSLFDTSYPLLHPVFDHFLTYIFVGFCQYHDMVVDELRQLTITDRNRICKTCICQLALHFHTSTAVLTNVDGDNINPWLYCSREISIVDSVYKTSCVQFSFHPNIFMLQCLVSSGLVSMSDFFSICAELFTSPSTGILHTSYQLFMLNSIALQRFSFIRDSSYSANVLVASRIFQQRYSPSRLLTYTQQSKAMTKDAIHEICTLKKGMTVDNAVYIVPNKKAYSFLSMCDSFKHPLTYIQMIDDLSSKMDDFDLDAFLRIPFDIHLSEDLVEPSQLTVVKNMFQDETIKMYLLDVVSTLVTTSIKGKWTTDVISAFHLLLVFCWINGPEVVLADSTWGDILSTLIGCAHVADKYTKRFFVVNMAQFNYAPFIEMASSIENMKPEEPKEEMFSKEQKIEAQQSLMNKFDQDMESLLAQFSLDDEPIENDIDVEVELSDAEKKQAESVDMLHCTDIHARENCPLCHEQLKYDFRSLVDRPCVLMSTVFNSTYVVDYSEYSESNRYAPLGFSTCTHIYHRDCYERSKTQQTNSSADRCGVCRTYTNVEIPILPNVLKLDNRILTDDDVKKKFQLKGKDVQALYEHFSGLFTPIRDGELIDSVFAHMTLGIAVLDGLLSTVLSDYFMQKWDDSAEAITIDSSLCFNFSTTRITLYVVLFNFVAFFIEWIECAFEDYGTECVNLTDVLSQHYFRHICGRSDATAVFFALFGSRFPETIMMSVVGISNSIQPITMYVLQYLGTVCGFEVPSELTAAQDMYVFPYKNAINANVQIVIRDQFKNLVVDPTVDYSVFNHSLPQNFEVLRVLAEKIVGKEDYNRTAVCLRTLEPFVMDELITSGLFNRPVLKIYEMAMKTGVGIFLHIPTNLVFIATSSRIHGLGMSVYTTEFGECDLLRANGNLLTLDQERVSQYNAIINKNPPDEFMKNSQSVFSMTAPPHSPQHFMNALNRVLDRLKRLRL